MLTSLRMRLWLVLAGLSGAGAVAAEAFARHRLDAQADAHAIELIGIASKYQGFYALSLIAVLILAEHVGIGFARRTVLVAGWAFTIGLVLFCGGLYAIVGGAPPSLAPIVPTGAALFVLGWLALIITALVGNR